MDLIDICDLQCKNALPEGMNETFVTHTGKMKILDYVLFKRITGHEAITYACPSICDHNMIFADFDFKAVKFHAPRPKIYKRTCHEKLGIRTSAGHQRRINYRKEIENRGIAKSVISQLDNPPPDEFQDELFTRLSKCTASCLKGAARKICGFKKINTKYSNKSITPQIKKWRKEIHLLRGTNLKMSKYNASRHAYLKRMIQKTMRDTTARKEREAIAKAKRKIDDNDPTALWRFLSRISRIRGSGKILYYNNEGIYHYSEQEISEGWISFLEILACRTDGDAGRPHVDSWKYTDKQF